MIINVVPRKFVKMFTAKDEFFKSNNFISIGEQEGYEGVSANGSNILKLVFDDASPAETGCTLFCLNKLNPSKNLLIRWIKAKRCM